MSVDVLTFGCRLNAVDGETIRAHARAGGAENLFVVNACAVTAEASRQARQAVHAGLPEGRQEDHHHDGPEVPLHPRRD
ncbi:hypothetical protein ACIKTA_15415, partial [Hansschlegelia beijingensis]